MKFYENIFFNLITLIIIEIKHILQHKNYLCAFFWKVCIADKCDHITDCGEDECCTWPGECTPLSDVGEGK